MKNTNLKDSPFLHARGPVENVADEIKKMTALAKKEEPKHKKKSDGNPVLERDMDEEKPH